MIPAAVASPIPGRARNASTPVGSAPPYSAEQISAARFKARARRLYPMPCHSSTTSATAAAERASMEGKRFINRSQRVKTRATCVCWSITSEIQMAYRSSCVAPRQIPIQARPLFADASDESGNCLIGYADGFGLARLGAVFGTCGDFASRASQRPHRLQRGFQA